MDLQGGSYNLQNGGAIQVGTSAPQAAPSTIQPSTNVMSYGGGGTGIYVGDGSGSYSGGGGGYAAPKPVDPYNSAQHAFLNNLQSALGTVRQGGTDAFQNAQNQLQGSANNITSGFKTGQQNIDLSRQNNELSRMNASQDLLGYIRNGLRQGASRLANMNATDSSATDALGRAYNTVGNQKQRSINNQAGVASHGIDIQQNQLNQGLQDQLSGFHLTRDNLVNQIGQNVRSSLAALNQQAVGLSLPDQIAVEQEKQNIIDGGMAQLQGVDSWLQNQVSNVQPMGNDQVLQGARSLQQAGTASPNQFNVGNISQTPIQGPQVDQLPLFSVRKGNQF